MLTIDSELSPEAKASIESEFRSQLADFHPETIEVRSGSTVIVVLAFLATPIITAFLGQIGIAVYKTVSPYVARFLRSDAETGARLVQEEGHANMVARSIGQETSAIIDMAGYSFPDDSPPQVIRQRLEFETETKTVVLDAEYKWDTSTNEHVLQRRSFTEESKN